MGLAALVMVMYRLCTKPRYLRRQHLAEQEYQNLDRSYAGYLRASLTSIQIRVLTRLRDRPPRYESRTRTQIEYPPPPSYDSINTVSFYYKKDDLFLSKSIEGTENKLSYSNLLYKINVFLRLIFI